MTCWHVTAAPIDPIATEALVRTFFVGMLLVMIFSAQRILAADVAFQLETKKLASIEKPQVPKPMTMKFKDRTWGAHGVEEALGEHSANCSTGWSVDYYRSVVFKVRDPIWTHNKLWPRTRESWGRGEYYRDVKIEYSPIALQQ
jgi:hypothetical protein